MNMPPLDELSTGFVGLVLAAGEGRRLKACSDQPKPLVPVGGRPLIEYSLEPLARAGIRRAIVVLGHRAEEVQQYLLDRRPFGLDFQFVRQHPLNGTAGAVESAQEALARRPFLMTYADNLCQYAFGPLLREHEEQGNSATLSLFETAEPSNHGIVEIRGRRILSMEERPVRPRSNLAFAGTALFEREIYAVLPEVPTQPGGEKYLTDAIPLLLARGKAVGYSRIKGWRLNINRPEDIAEAEARLARSGDSHSPAGPHS
ncbi:MAG: nucleotidyltransferase family protein [Planctomycetes bacterium]|nr:nucleotidyltransferase family protein [Planctomycetota bacterium]